MEMRCDRLIDLMHNNKMSYQDLANATGIHKATLQRYFTGHSKIPTERMWPIAYALNTTPNYIMGDTDDPSPSFMTTMLEESEINNLLDQIKKKAKDNNALMSLIELILPLNQMQMRSVSSFITVMTKGEF